MARKSIPLNSKWGKLTVLAEAGIIGRRLSYLCSCECGATVTSPASEIRRGRTKQCRKCAMAPVAIKKTDHGDCGSPEYRSWSAMLSRCYCPTNPAYDRYGGRGIGVHPGWRRSYSSFLKYMGRRPTMLHTLDRIDNDLGYLPGNVRWADKKTQSRNRRTTRLFCIDGVHDTIAAWCKHYGAKYETVRRQVRQGVDLESILKKEGTA